MKLVATFSFDLPNDMTDEEIDDILQATSRDIGADWIKWRIREDGAVA